MSVWMFLVVFGMIWWAASRRGCGSRRRNPSGNRDSEELGNVRDLLSEMDERLARLEEERDFYRELMGSQARFQRVGRAEPRMEAKSSSSPQH